MGNTSKKLAAKCTLLDKEEQKYLAATFRAASKNSEKMREEDLIMESATLLNILTDEEWGYDIFQRYWGPYIDPRLAQFLSNFLFGYGAQKAQQCDFQRFAELYVYNNRGSPEERVTTIYNSLGMDYNSSSELPYQLLREYCEALASTYLKVLKSSTSKRAQKWINKGFRGKPSHVQALGEAVAAAVGGDVDPPPNTCNSDQIYRWINTNILLKQMTEMVFVNLYGAQKKIEDNTPLHAVPSLLPVPEGLEAMPDYPAFIDLSHIVWLNVHLPKKHQHKWRFLFSSHIHGESFSTMAGRIIEQGATVIIIQDNAGYIFGGYADQAWAYGATFYGTESSFLFTVAPKMRIYPATTYNNHYQYMNSNTKTLPNGLLMGGQFNFGGIWVNADPFGEGSSAESCSTYRGYKRLSKEPTFHIRALEVWGVGDKPLSVKESLESIGSRSSVLDTHRSERQFLQLTSGKGQISAGFRDTDR